MASSTLYTQYSQHANATITVTNTAELNAALAQLDTSGGGTILLDGNGGPYNISGNGIGDANNPILIKALDPANIPVVENISLTNASYISMTELHVDSSGAANPGAFDITINGSDHIELVGNTMTSVADGYLDGAGGATRGADLGFVRNSSDITVSNNYMADYAKGFAFRDVNGFDFSNNEMTGIQFDGLQGTGWQNATITNNYMHDFYGSVQTLNHSDFIQIYSVNANLVTSNVQISGNILDTGSGAAYQGIFITSQTFGQSGASGQYYQNIQVFDNLIHTGKWNGIVVGSTMGAQIYDNTVLFNPASYVQASPGAALTQGQPWIKTSNAPDAVIYDNIVSKITASNGNWDSQNFIMDFTNPNAPNYFGNHIVDLTGGGTGAPTLDDLALLPSSPLYGSMGSYYSTVGGTWDSGGGNWQPAPTPSPNPTPVPTPTPTPVPVPDDTTGDVPDTSGGQNDTGNAPADNGNTTPDNGGGATDTGSGTGSNGGNPVVTPPANDNGNHSSQDLVKVFSKSVGQLQEKFGGQGKGASNYNELAKLAGDIQVRSLLATMQQVSDDDTDTDEDDTDEVDYGLVG